MTIQDFTTRLLAHMGVDEAQVTVDEGEEVTVHIQVTEEESGLLIGYHGESMTAIQRILYMTFSRDDQSKRFIVNVNDYKERRTEQLHEMVKTAAEKVLANGEQYLFSFLSPSERLIVHEYVAQNPEYAELESYSSGDGHQRRLHLRVKREQAQSQAAA